MYNETISFYSKNPTNKWKLEDFTIKHFEENRTCWDDLEVFLKINDWKILDWSFYWDTSIITTACASIFWESIIAMDIKDILNLNYSYIKDLVWEDISPRRHKAAVLWLLCTRNAIHKYLDDSITDDFDMLINI